jgi:hypothetical protein
VSATVIWAESHIVQLNTLITPGARAVLRQRAVLLSGQIAHLNVEAVHLYLTLTFPRAVPALVSEIALRSATDTGLEARRHEENQENGSGLHCPGHGEVERDRQPVGCRPGECHAQEMLPRGETSVQDRRLGIQEVDLRR